MLGRDWPRHLISPPPGLRLLPRHIYVSVEFDTFGRRDKHRTYGGVRVNKTVIVNPGPVSTFIVRKIIVRKIIVRKIHIDSPALQYITIANTAQQDSSLISADINADLGIQSGRPIKKNNF